MKKILLAIDGMTCSACSNGLEKYLNKQKGISQASVNLVMANALIEYEEEILTQEQIEKFVKEAGFKSLGLYQEKAEKEKQEGEKQTFFLFLLLSIIVFYISMGHMLGLPSIPFLDMHTNPIAYTFALCFLSIAFIIYGWDILKNGYKNLVHKTPNMDTLVAIGVVSSMLYSFYSMYEVIKGNHAFVEHLYFESVAMVIFFIKLGRYIDGLSKDKTKDAIQKLVKITPTQATIKREGAEKVVTIDEIQKGDIVISRPGEKMAVDGEIIKGKAHLDESFLTGESKPVSKTIGNKVIAGSINYDGYIEYQAEKIGKESTISEIVRLVMEATNTKAPIAKMADKVSGYFVPAVILIAILTFFAYLFLGQGISVALIRFVTVLVVACPCSLGLATPLAIVVSEGLCASQGILVKKSEILENAQKTTMVVLDKTGTLTYGRLKIAEVIHEDSREKKELLQWAASIESKSTHPIGKAFTDYAKENKLDLLEVKELEEISGHGIVGTVKKRKIILGNAKILEKYQIENPYQEEEKKLAQKGNSIAYMVEDKKVIALFGVNDMVRENAKEVIQSLKKRKIETMMLTGDNPETAEKIAKEIGITKVIANVLPSGKAEFIQKLKQEGNYVMMCGDGINDSPALASSDIGVSFHSGTDIAMDSSEVILTKNDLASVLHLIQISKKTIRNIKQNLFWAFFYNVLMIPVAVGALAPWGITINPMLASMAMVISSFTVVLNALRLRKIKMR